MFKTIALILVTLVFVVCCGGCSSPNEAESHSGAPTTTPQQRRVFGIVLGGQSNAVGASGDSKPAGLPDRSIPFWRDDYYYKDGPHTFVPLDVYRNGTYGVEIAAARTLQAAGNEVFVIKLVRGATYITSWLPDVGYGTLFYPELAEAWAVAVASYPGAELVPVFAWYQGEEEAVYKHKNDVAALAYVQQWGGHFATIHTAVDAVIGPTQPYVFRCNSAIAGGNHVAELQAEQASVADAKHLILTDDAQLEADGKHNTGAASNMLGERFGAAVLAAEPR